VTPPSPPPSGGPDPAIATWEQTFDAIRDLILVLDAEGRVERANRAARERLGVVSGMLALTRTLGQTTGIAVLGAAWASRVFHHTGESLAGGATEAPPIAQVAGLQDTFLGIVVVIVVALGLAAWGLAHSHQDRAATAAKATSLQ